MSRKKKSIAALGAAIAEREKNSTDQTSAVQQLVEAYLSTNNEAKRAKKIAEIKSRCGGLNELLSQNSELLTAEVEQALLRLVPRIVPPCVSMPEKSDGCMTLYTPWISP